MIEAMSAGCVCVHPSLAGLPETGAGFTDMYDFVPNRFEHEKVFEQELEKSILKVMSGNYDTSKQKQVTDDTYSWDNRIVEWQNYLDHLKVNNEIFGNRGELQA
jgi:hypothetical protein